MRAPTAMGGLAESHPGANVKQQVTGHHQKSEKIDPYDRDQPFAAGNTIPRASALPPTTRSGSPPHIQASVITDFSSYRPELPP